MSTICQRGTKTVQPPAIAVASQRVPSIDRIAPQLARRAEIIRRNARHSSRISASVQVKVLRIGPDIGAIVSDINRQIAHDAHSALPRIFSQRSPLCEENELKEFLCCDRFS